MQAPVHNQSVMVRRAQGALTTVYWVYVNTTVHTVGNCSIELCTWEPWLTLACCTLHTVCTFPCRQNSCLCSVDDISAVNCSGLQLNLWSWLSTHYRRIGFSSERNKDKLLLLKFKNHWQLFIHDKTPNLWWTQWSAKLTKKTWKQKTIKS